MPTLPQNPFDNLFGESSQKTASKNSNPFEGLFDKQATQQQQPAPKQELKFEAPKEGVKYVEQKKEPSIWIKAARAVLPKNVEDFFGISDEAQKRKEFMAQYEEAYASSDLRRLEKQLQEGGGKLPKQTAADVAKETKPEEYLPFVSAVPKIVEAVQLYQSAKRLEAGEETMVDLYRITKYRAEAERDKTFGAQVAGVLTQLPSFGGELLLTGGTYTAGKKATEKIIAETLEKVAGKKAGSILARSAGTIVGGTLQTIPARGLEITAGTIENMIPEYSFTASELGQLRPVITGEGDDLFKALVKSGFNQWVEVVSEHSGGILSEMTTPVKNQLLKISALKAFLESNPTATSKNFMTWVKRAGWNGVLGEMFEERVGEVARGLGTQLGISEEGWKIPSPQQLAVELVSFSVPGAMIETSNRMLQGGSIESAVKEKQRPITQAENIIGARDILTVGKGGTDLNGDKIAYLQNELDNYHSEVSQPVIEILESDRTPIAQISVVQYPDGKWGYSYSIDTPEVSFSADFLANNFTATREQAVSTARAKLLNYINEAETNVPEESKAELQKIVGHLERVYPTSDVPIEVRKGDQAVSSKISELVRGYQTYGGYTAGKEAPNAYLRDLASQLKTETGQEVGRDSVDKAIESGEIKTDKRGFITLYRVGEIGKLNELYSATYDKEFAQQFSEANGQPITEFSVMPTQIKYVVGGVEKEVLLENKETKTQKEKVAEAVEGKPKTIKEIAKETKILEPNVRRILGVGAKDGTFERVDKGVYVLKKGDKQIAYVETGDAVDVLPRLAKEGFKADMVFLDIPYKTQAVSGGNRGAKFEFITTDQFAKVVEAVKTIARYDSTPVFYMYSQAPSGAKEMQKYTDKMTEAGFVPVAKGEYTKLQKDGITRTRNMRGLPDYPEGIILFTKDGTANFANPDLNFKLIRPKGYQTEKPAEMARKLIEMSTKEGEVVLDPFAGSGVVPAEAVKAGRQAVAIEKSEKAVEEFIKPRIEEASKTETKPKEKQPRFAKPIQKTAKPMQKAGKTTQSHIVASRILPKRPDFDALGQISVRNGNLYANDLEVALRLKTELKDGAYKIVGKEAVKTDVNQEDFPIFPEVKGDPAGTMISENLKNTLKKAVLHIDKNFQYRPEITGVYMRIGGNEITFASTDSKRMFIKKVPAKITGEGEFILSNPDKVQKIIADIGGLSAISFDEKAVRFSGDNGEIVARRIDGEYPAYKQIIPAYKKRYTFDRKQMLDALKELKPFTNKTYPAPGIKFTYKDGKWTLVAENEKENLKKEIVLNTTATDVRVNASSENSGVLVMPIVVEKGEGDFSYDINYLLDTFNSFDEDGIYLYLPEKPENTAGFFSAESQLKSEETGENRTIKKGTKLFHGTTKNNAASIIQDGIYRTEDETATYGRAVYLTPDYQTAQDYANETGEGQVVELKPLTDLKLYQPTISEREDLIDKTGQAQDDLIKKILPEGFDGFYIPDDGRGDGGEQVILYSDADIFERAMANEIRGDAKKSVAPKPKKKKAPSGIASAGADALGNFEDLAGKPNKTAEEFKLFEEVKGLIKKYANTIGEDYLPSNAIGVYYPDTTNIRIKGMNHLSVAAHEITHFLDFAYKISNQIMGIKGYTENGKPIYDSSTYKIRKEMTALYEKYYPGGSRKHKLRKRMLEGFATLLEKYTEQPSTITAEFPNLVKEFLTTEGKYYKPVMGDIIRDLRQIVAKYQALPALDKIGSRVINDEVNVNKDSFLNFWQKLKTTIADNVYPIEVLAKKAGARFTKADPSLWVRQYNNSNALILNNINGNRGFWGWRNGELSKLHDFNWKDLITDLKQQKATDEFAYWLVARREYFGFQELKQLEKAVKVSKEAVKAAQYAVQQARETGADLADFEADVRRVMNAYDTAKRNYDDAKKVLDSDGFTEKEASEAYLLNKERFADLERKFDTLVKEDLNFLNDPSVGLVDNEQYNQLSSREGYASFKRYFYDEVVGEEEGVMPTKMRFGRTKVSSLIKRTGSQKPIYNPLYSSLKNHAEITRKGLKQIVYNRIGELALNNPDLGLFQSIPLKSIPDRNGRLLFPQEKDPNTIMARLNYKRRPFLTDITIKRTIDEVLNFQNISAFEKLLMGASRFFTKGTTGLFPGFALTNYAVDQITASAQTRNKYKVLYDPLKKLWSARWWNDSKQHAYLQEYLVMGGERQTFVGWQDMSPNELFDAIQNERKGLLKVIDGLNKGMDILAIPSQWSEIATRATEYIKAREAGKTQVVALEEAGRVTAPFHHIGRWGGGKVGQTYIKSIPFFNPSIQVLAQAAETLETPEGRRQYAFVSLAVVAASIAGLGMIMAYGSDDQKREFADKQPDELNKYIWYPLPGGKGLGKIRVPDQMEVIATIINMVWADKALQANYTAGEYLAAGVSWLPQQFSPELTKVDGLGYLPVKAFMGWVPQIIKPGFLTLAGVKDFPKIMPIESQTVQNRAPEFRYTETTSPVAKWLGSVLKMSPIKIDYLVTGYAGRATGFLTGKPGIYNPTSQLSSQYYFTSGRKLQKFYDIKEKNDQDYEAYKKGRKDYALGERTAILKLRAKLKIIESTIGLYKDVDENSDKAKKYREKILSLIDEL